MTQQQWQRGSSGVRSQPLGDEWRDEPQPKQQPKSRASLSIGLVLLAIGLPMWIVGSRYTLDGLVIGVNWLLAWLSVPQAVPAPANWWRAPESWGIAVGAPVAMLAGMLIVGLLFSRIEVRYRPMRKIGKHWHSASLDYWLVWLVLVAIDVGSTYAGFRAEAHTWALSASIAGTWVWSGLWALVLTFVPEWLILTGGKRISR